MEQVAIDAAQTATIWFDEDPIKGRKELDRVIACGQFTMYFTLLGLIAQIEQRPDSNITPEIEKVRDRAMKIMNSQTNSPEIDLAQIFNPDAQGFSAANMAYLAHCAQAIYKPDSECTEAIANPY